MCLFGCELNVRPGRPIFWRTRIFNWECSAAHPGDPSVFGCGGSPSPSSLFSALSASSCSLWSTWVNRGGNPKPTLLDCSRSSVAASDKVINGQLQDFIHQEVYGEQPLFPIKNKLPRNRILIISYSTASRVAVEVTRNKKLFSVNVNKKLEEADSPSLRLTWSKKPTSAAVLSSLNLIRNVFDCDRENSSKLLSKEERVGCQEKKLRAVLISALPVVDLEPILGQYGPRLKVDQIKDVGYWSRNREWIRNIFIHSRICAYDLYKSACWHCCWSERFCHI